MSQWLRFSRKNSDPFHPFRRTTRQIAFYCIGLSLKPLRGCSRWGDCRTNFESVSRLMHSLDRARINLEILSQLKPSIAFFLWYLSPGTDGTDSYIYYTETAGFGLPTLLFSKVVLHNTCQRIVWM